MKIVKKAFEKDGGGSVTLVPDEDEDMWHVFNLVSATELDRVKASTIRCPCLPAPRGAPCPLASRAPLPA
eukprot:COSAG04_NODE_765_length_10500_cov_7.566869_14_plen_70_part_00